jgi:DNA-binding IclR family transcriptional regulator
MEAIANRFQASVSIAARDGLQMVIAGRAAAHTFLRLNFQVGSSLRIERSAVGCAYLAGTTEENRKDLMAAIKLAYPKEWKENKGYIEESLSLYRSRGYVLNLRRYHPEVNALGVPIVSSSGRQVMALNCGGASSIMSREMLEGPVAQAMTQLASDLAPMLGI